MSGPRQALAYPPVEGVTTSGEIGRCYSPMVRVAYIAGRVFKDVIRVAAFGAETRIPTFGGVFIAAMDAGSCGQFAVLGDVLCHLALVCSCVATPFRAVNVPVAVL